MAGSKRNVISNRLTKADIDAAWDSVEDSGARMTPPAKRLQLLQSVVAHYQAMGRAAPDNILRALRAAEHDTDTRAAQYADDYEYADQVTAKLAESDD